MNLTYSSADEADADRAQQLRLLAALGGWDRALRRDECATWRIEGRHGAIYTDGRTWLMHVECRSVRHWSAVRAKLAAFAAVVMDGDDEGVVRLHRLPGPGQAEVIRSALGLRKRAEISAAHRERLLAIGFGSHPHELAVSGARIGGSGAGVEG